MLGGGICEESERVVQVGKEIGELPSTTYQYKNFLGWYDSVEGGIQITSSYIVDVSKTLYAQWESISVTVTFNSNGHSGTPSFSSKTVTYGSTYGELPTIPNETNYTFSGWKINNATISANSTVTVTSDVIAYAIWVGKEISVTADPCDAWFGDKTWFSVYTGTGYSYVKTPYTKTFHYGDTLGDWNYRSNSVGGEYPSLVGFSTAKNNAVCTYWTDSVVTAPMTIYAQYTITQYCILSYSPYQFAGDIQQIIVEKGSRTVTTIPLTDLIATGVNKSFNCYSKYNIKIYGRNRNKEYFYINSSGKTVSLGIGNGICITVPVVTGSISDKRTYIGFTGTNGTYILYLNIKDSTWSKDLVPTLIT